MTSCPPCNGFLRIRLDAASVRDCPFATSHELGPPSLRNRVRGDVPGRPMALDWEREMEAMVLSTSEESLIRVVRMLPPDEARKVLVWARELADLGRGRRVDWSDSWSDDDLRDATAASLERFAQQEREER